MSDITAVCLDLAKTVFQFRAADGAGPPVFRKKLRRDQVLDFLGRMPKCVSAMSACGGAHFRTRGHRCRGRPLLRAGVR